MSRPSLAAPGCAATFDFNLNQRNAQGQESCWEGFPSYRIRGDTERMVTGTGGYAPGSCQR